MPDREQLIRLQLRHLRRSLHELTLASDVGVVEAEAIDDLADKLTDVVLVTDAELTRLRERA